MLPLYDILPMALHRFGLHCHYDARVAHIGSLFTLGRHFTAIMPRFDLPFFLTTQVSSSPPVVGVRRRAWMCLSTELAQPSTSKSVLAELRRGAIIFCRSSWVLD